jgi:RNA polymerase sigma factor (sigma-70 family)
MSPLALSIRFLQTQPDAKLVELARAGHERAFEALVQRYRRQLLSYCRRISGSEAAAEDALQQGLLQAWIALSSGEVEVRDARAWLYRIAHNVAVSHRRRPVHDSVEVDRAVAAGGIDRADGASGADHEVERRLAVRQALAGLASLPDLQRQVMLSAAIEGQSHDEIAAALGLSHGAVRGLIYRARAALRAAAAAVTPSPLVHWAARQELGAGGRSAGVYEAIVGGGSAGVGGLLVKGGAVVVTAGALATAAGITTGPNHSRPAQRRADEAAAHGLHRGAVAVPVSGGAGSAQRVQLTALSVPGSGSAGAGRSAAAGTRGALNRGAHHGGPRALEQINGSSRGGGRSPHRSSGSSGSSGSAGSSGSSGGDHRGSTSHGGSTGSGSSGESSGHDPSGGSGGGLLVSSGGSTAGSGGGDHVDGGHDGAVLSSASTTTSSGSGSASGSGSGGGSDDHHDSGAGGGSGTTTTTVTATSTTSSAGASGGE